MVLVTDQKWEFDVHLLKTVLPFSRRVLLQLDLPMRQYSLHQEVKTYEELDDLVVLFGHVESLGERVDFKNLGGKFVHFLLLQQIHKETLLIDCLNNYFRKILTFSEFCIISF